MRKYTHAHGYWLNKMLPRAASRLTPDKIISQLPNSHDFLGQQKSKK